MTNTKHYGLARSEQAILGVPYLASDHASYTTGTQFRVDDVGSLCTGQPATAGECQVRQRLVGG